MLDRVAANPETLGSMLLRLRHLGIAAAAGAPAAAATENPTVEQHNITDMFEGWDYLVVQSSQKTEYRLYSTLPIRKHLLEKKIDLIQNQITQKTKEMQEHNKKKSIFASSITTTPELQQLETDLKGEQEKVPTLEDDLQNTGIYTKWNQGDPMYFDKWYNPKDGLYLYENCALNERQTERKARWTKIQRDPNYLVVHKFVELVLSDNIWAAEQGPSVDVVKELRRYENPESYEWWKPWEGKLADCDLKEGHDLFERLKENPQVLQGKHTDEEKWYYEEALGARERRLLDDETHRRLQLDRQAMFWIKYNEQYPSR
jgi:hypothetical protein